MSIDTLVHSCLKEGTSLSEQGKSVTIRKNRDEIVFLFNTDCDATRRVLGIRKACDATFFYMRHRGRPVLLFVELKGKDVGHAAEQIMETMHAIKNLVRDSVTSNFPQPDDMRAVVVRSGAAPHGQADIQDRFFKSTGVRLRFEREVADLRKFLT